MQVSSILVSTSPSSGLDNLRGSPSTHSLGQVTPSPSSSRTTLVFSKTPVPPPSTSRSQSKSKVKKRPPTPGGPAVGANPKPPHLQRHPGAFPAPSTAIPLSASTATSTSALTATHHLNALNPNSGGGTGNAAVVTKKSRDRLRPKTELRVEVVRASSGSIGEDEVSGGGGEASERSLHQPGLPMADARGPAATKPPLSLQLQLPAQQTVPPHAQALASPTSFPPLSPSRPMSPTSPISPAYPTSLSYQSYPASPVYLTPHDPLDRMNPSSPSSPSSHVSPTSPASLMPTSPTSLAPVSPGDSVRSKSFVSFGSDDSPLPHQLQHRFDLFVHAGQGQGETNKNRPHQHPFASCSLTSLGRNKDRDREAEENNYDENAATRDLPSPLSMIGLERAEQNSNSRYLYGGEPSNNPQHPPHPQPQPQPQPHNQPHNQYHHPQQQQYHQPITTVKTHQQNRTSVCSSVPDSPSTQALMQRLLSAPDVHGIQNASVAYEADLGPFRNGPGNAHGSGGERRGGMHRLKKKGLVKRRTDRDDGGVGVDGYPDDTDGEQEQDRDEDDDDDEEEEDSDSSIRFASADADEVMERVRRQREGNRKVQRLLGSASDDDVVRPPRRGAHAQGGYSSSKDYASSTGHQPYLQRTPQRNRRIQEEVWSEEEEEEEMEEEGGDVWGTPYPCGGAPVYQDPATRRALLEEKRSFQKPKSKFTSGGRGSEGGRAEDDPLPPPIPAPVHHTRPRLASASTGHSGGNASRMWGAAMSAEGYDSREDLIEHQQSFHQHHPSQNQPQHGQQHRHLQSPQANQRYAASHGPRQLADQWAAAGIGSRAVMMQSRASQYYDVLPSPTSGTPSTAGAVAFGAVGGFVGVSSAAPAPSSTHNTVAVLASLNPNHSPAPAQPPKRVFALDSLNPNHSGGGIKRSHSASAGPGGLAAGFSTRGSRRSMAGTAFPSITAFLSPRPSVSIGREKVKEGREDGDSFENASPAARPPPSEPPLISVRTSSKVVGERLKKANGDVKEKRRRSALVWVKEGLGVGGGSETKPASSSDPALAPLKDYRKISFGSSSQSHNATFARDVGTNAGGKRTLGYDPKRNGSMPSAHSFSSGEMRGGAGGVSREDLASAVRFKKDSLDTSASPLSQSHSPGVPSPNSASMNVKSPASSANHATNGGGKLSTPNANVKRAYSQSYHSLSDENKSDYVGVSPYYTVVGARPGFTERVGSTVDRWHEYEAGRWDADVLHSRVGTGDDKETDKKEEKKEKGGGAGVFSFGLKRSGSRWKGVGGGGDKEKEGKEKRSRDALRGRSVHEHNAVKKPEDGVNPSGDWGYPTSGVDSASKTSTTTTTTAISANPGPTRPSLSRHRRSHSFSDRFDEGIGNTPFSSDPALEGRYELKESVGGTKFWKLVKKMGSSNALRDKSVGQSGLGGDGSGPLPPIPSVPPNSASPTNSEAVNGSEVLDRLLQNSTLRSGSGTVSVDGEGVTVDYPPSPTATATSSKPTTPAKLTKFKYSVLGSRSSTSTPGGSTDQITMGRSSLSGLHRTVSNRSSVESGSESLGHHSLRGGPGGAEDAPPVPQLPDGVLDSGRLMPSPVSAVDRGNLSDSGYNNKAYNARGGRRVVTDGNGGQWATSEANTLELEFPSLPTPPGRPRAVVSTTPDPPDMDLEEALYRPGGAEDGFEDAESPIIPEFSTANVVNVFKKRGGKLEGVAEVTEEENVKEKERAKSVRSTSTSSSGPPPRPARDVRRPLPPTSPIVEKALEKGVKDEIKAVDVKRGSDDKETLPEQDYDSFGPRPLTSSFGPNPLLTLTDPRREEKGSFDLVITPTEKPQTLTEKEKAAKWDALLRKSAMAGGTLHLSFGVGGGLESDGLDSPL
ncbi:hypothetical protein FA15DRAFT_669908 [Coprinopsis marcescibilis]|uniref:Uncharacterized protein n=1 Tax=Coprinopsis marcescibilis TaxID=230819 RepID=A0A5C3KTX3_COPMA|nr:hypothetical protein FA15DRAFT_669908 [Coprinopsis marcescibilis]